MIIPLNTLGYVFKEGVIMFNIYYINYNKAFEIAMLNSNEIIDFEEQEISLGGKKSTSKHTDGSVNATAKVPWLTKFGVAVKAGIGSSVENNTLERLKRNVQVIQSNSILLEGVLELVYNVDLKQPLEEGTLVKIDNLSLKIENEEDVRTAKMLAPGTISQIEVSKIEGMQLNVDSLITSVLSDYFYIVSGTTLDGKNTLLKIPLSDSFQSSYSIDDLLIGKVSVVGLYKGIVTEKDLSNTFNFLKSVGKEQKNSKESQIVESAYEKNNIQPVGNSEKEYHFIDTIAVLQNVVLFKEGNLHV